jgi:predicted dehydrogenase
MQKKKYRVGILGCGSVSNFHLEGWKAWRDDAEVVALCDINPQQIEKTRTKWADLCGGATGYADYREMLAKEKLDIVAVLTQGDLHYELTRACLMTGAHVFMEKPVGYSLEEARKFKFLAYQFPQQKVGVAFTLRYYREFMDLRAVIKAGTLGRIISGEISYSHPHTMPEDVISEADSAELQKKEKELTYLAHQSDVAGGDATLHRGAKVKNPFADNGGNYIESSQLTHATHPWDMVRFLLGEPKEVFCTNVSTVVGGVAVQMGILWMESGAVVHVLAGQVRVPKIGGNQHQFAQIHGTRGSAWLMRDLYAPYDRHAYYRTDGEIQEAARTSELPNSTHGTIIRTRNFMDAIEGKAELICSMEDGAKTTDMLHAVYLSERMQTKVAVLPAHKTG